jgi:hypothetical protein
MSLSTRRRNASADDLPVAPIVHELELEAIEIRAEPAEHTCTRSLSHEPRVHDGARGIRSLKLDRVDTAHDLDPLIRDE